MRIALLLAAAAIVVSSAGGASTATALRAAPTAVELTQMLGKGNRLQLVVSDAGASATETRGKMRVGVVVDYESGQLYPLNYEKRTYYAQPIATAVAELKRERGYVAKLRTEEDLRRDKTHAPKLKAPTLTPLGLKATIAGLGAQAYALHQEGVKTPVRLWLADDVPTPPEALRAQLRGAVVLPLTTSRMLLRTEIQLGKRWVTGLDTVASRELDVTAETFAPPRGWRQVAPPKVRRPASIPARPSRLFGPVAANPDVFALYWNGPFTASFRTSVNVLLSSMVGGGAAPSPYWTPLAQYGVGRGRFLGSSAITFPLPADVGTWNFLAVQGLVTAAQLTTPAPKIWWRAFGRDPILAIFVSSAAVSPSSWTGYHLASLTVGAFLPWPVSLAAHPVIPWFLTKSTPITAPPGMGTTTNLSHELVETATDPLPLSANVDFSKSPPWSGGEIADICSFGPPLPVSTTILRFGATLSRYWSNAAGACVG